MNERWELQPDSWQSYLDDLSSRLEGRVGELEITGTEISDSLTQDLSTLHGLTYEPASDRIEIFLEGLTHSILHPRKVSICGSDELPTRVEIVDKDGLCHKIDLRANSDERQYRGDESRLVG